MSMAAQVAWYDGGALNTFKFTFSAEPRLPFRFDSSHAILQEHGAIKRRRPLWDVDGRTEFGKKKRRLRLNLITSKLGKPFSSPASHVADHGVKKVTELAGRGNLVLENGHLRKTALANCVRKRVDDMKALSVRARALVLPSPPHFLRSPQPVRTHSQLMCQTALRDVAAVRPRTPETSTSLPRSPLGQSNYDALDLEDEEEFGATYESDEDGNYAGSRASGSTKAPRTLIEGENYDFLDDMDGISHDGADTCEAPETRWWGC